MKKTQGLNSGEKVGSDTTLIPADFKMISINSITNSPKCMDALLLRAFTSLLKPVTPRHTTKKNPINKFVLSN
jgi:hypothetical protein